MQITPSLVRDLRERTGAGMMDCKRALEETSGDLEQAIDFLRKQGLKSAEKKADREMGEGRVFSSVTQDGRVGSMVAITCETDFVSRTPDFEKLLEDLVAHVEANAPANAEAMLGQAFKPTGTSVEEAIKQTIGKLGENIQLARVMRLENPEGQVGTYVHHNQRVGVLVSVTTSKTGPEAAEALKSVCMHAAAMKPAFARREDVPAEDVEREKAIFMEEVKSKPGEIQEKIVKGKLEKFYADVVLGEQPWFKDDSMTVAKAVTQMLGDGSRIEAFARFQVGG
jgi:elongation factor Ts